MFFNFKPKKIKLIKKKINSKNLVADFEKNLIKLCRTSSPITLIEEKMIK